MSLYTSTTGTSGILPEEYGKLIVEPVMAQALAFDADVATVVTTKASEFNIPVVRSDAGASWVAEGAEITEDDPNLDEIVVKPSKVAGLTIVSRELANDSSPSAQQIVGEGLARSIASQVDAAFLGDLAAPAPKGLESIDGVSVIDTGGALTNLDPFAEAVSAAEEAGANISAFILSPADALTVATLKDTANSNKNLLEDPRTILGRPVKVNKNIPAGTAWAVDKTRIITVLREGTTLAVSGEAYFSSDRVGIRATMRVGFGFPSEDAIVKMHDAA